ncbi:succinate dehydrogenase [ubiquinone] cytochrome b small subunit, mitochondrial-like [Cochliomyia hominivorax]
MSAILLKYYTNKFCVSETFSKAKSYQQLSKNLHHILTNKIRSNHKSLKSKQKQIVSINYLQCRKAITSLITIKEYKSSRKYTKLWKLERFMGWTLTVLIPLAFYIESQGLEMILAANGLIHTYCGCQSMCSDYVRSSVVGKILPIIIRSSVVILTLLSFVGYYHLIYRDVGLINMIKKFWSIRGKDYASK